ncbi:MAG: glycosyltransferase [Verrucomicrobiales bacterium]
MKIGLITKALAENGHSVTMISQGEIVENHFKYYAGFCDTTEDFDGVPVYYASAVPIRRINGRWSAYQVQRLLARLHSENPFDCVIIYNLKMPQVYCALFAREVLRLPVLFEYEDDAFTPFPGEKASGLLHAWHQKRYRNVLRKVSGCMAVSPYLLAQTPENVPKLLIRGIVANEIEEAVQLYGRTKFNRVVFSGTHSLPQGLEQLIEAWQKSPLSGWELHIAGEGPLTPKLKSMASEDTSIVFHGLLSRMENAKLLVSAKLAIVPYNTFDNPGRGFAFKTIECLAAGLHVISTPMGEVEKELAEGMTIINDNNPETIVKALNRSVEEKVWEKTAQTAACKNYGFANVCEAIGQFVHRACEYHRHSQFV